MTEGASVSRGGGWSAPVLFASLRGYRRSWAMADVFAGVTLLAIAVPEQLATSRLAGMPPVTGLYAFVAGTAAFALLGANPRLSVGADSTIAPLFAIGVAHYASTGSHRYVDLVGILAVTVGAFVALVGVLRLGWIAEFLSVPIITGFLAGVAVVIVAHQLPDLFGLPATGGSTPHRLGDVFSHLGNTNGWTLGIGVAVLVMAVAAERVDRRLPAALFGLVGSGVVVGGLGLAAHGVVVLGHVTHSAPRWGLVGLSWSALGDLLPIAGVVALVVVSQSAATTRAFAEDIDGGHPDVNRDFLGVGAGSILAGLVGSFPVNASPVRTAAVASASGRSQAGGLGAAAAVILLIPAAGALRDVPVAALAAVLIFVAARLFRVGSLIAIAKFDLFEAGLALVTLLIVSLVGVEQGIAAAVGLAILDRTRLSARPQIHVLGRIPTTTSWAPIGTEGAAPVPGVLVVLFATPLWYANSVHFQAQLERALSRAGRPQAVVLDAVGMSDVDFTGSQVLKQVLDRFEQAQVSFAVARAGEHARRSMSRSGLAGRIGEDRFFASVDEAVRGLLPDPRLGSGSS
ncbi:MAG TPA: SulP family inorganic anion transporter [Acidimicrobiales bacterium]|nr:SulP family inorganic anion transporter [Acidimicrobiales bacterium]